jgi:hypothetical protein
MVYVTHEMAALWKDREWEFQSLENVRSRSAELGTHSWLREDGSCYGLIMLYADGLGPSRLLLNTDLEAPVPAETLRALRHDSEGNRQARLAKDGTRALEERQSRLGQRKTRDDFDLDRRVTVNGSIQVLRQSLEHLAAFDELEVGIQLGLQRE